MHNNSQKLKTSWPEPSRLFIIYFFSPYLRSFFSFFRFAPRPHPRWLMVVPLGITYQFSSKEIIQSQMFDIILYQKVWCTTYPHWLFKRWGKFSHHTFLTVSYDQCPRIYLATWYMKGHARMIPVTNGFGPIFVSFYPHFWQDFHEISNGNHILEYHSKIHDLLYHIEQSQFIRISTIQWAKNGSRSRIWYHSSVTLHIWK